MLSRSASPFSIDTPLSTAEVVERIDTAAGDIATQALVIAGQIARIARLTKASASHARVEEWDISLVLLNAAREQLDNVGLSEERHSSTHRWLERAIDAVQTSIATSQAGVHAPVEHALGSLIATIGHSTTSHAR